MQQCTLRTTPFPCRRFAPGGSRVSNRIEVHTTAVLRAPLGVQYSIVQYQPTKGKFPSLCRRPKSGGPPPCLHERARGSKSRPAAQRSGRPPACRSLLLRQLPAPATRRIDRSIEHGNQRTACYLGTPPRAGGPGVDRLSAESSNEEENLPFTGWPAEEPRVFPGRPVGTLFRGRHR